jgi:hypothetical protein
MGIFSRLGILKMWKLFVYFWSKNSKKLIFGFLIKSTTLPSGSNFPSQGLAMNGFWEKQKKQKKQGNFGHDRKYIIKWKNTKNIKIR